MKMKVMRMRMKKTTKKKVRMRTRLGRNKCGVLGVGDIPAFVARTK